MAEILWYTNPKVKAIWDLLGDTPIYIQPNDTSIKEVLHELDLAWSYGLSEDMRADNEKLVEMINRSVPGLELVPPGVPATTITMSPPTETPVLTATETSPPTVSPTFTLEPIVSLTLVATTNPAPATNNVLLLVALGLIAVGGVYVYLLKAKNRR